MRFLETWKDYSTSRRNAFKASIVGGLVLIGAGVGVDYTVGWGDTSFLVNLLSSLSSFLIGAPVALVVLSTITSEREEKAQKDKVRRLSEAAWSEFVDASEFLCNDRVQDALTFRAIEANTAYRQIVSRMKGYGVGDVDRLVNVDFIALRGRINDAASKIDDLSREINGALTSRRELQTRWSALVNKWNVLNDYVRIQRLEYELPWFQPGIDADLADSLSRPECPPTDFLSRHEKNGVFGPQSANMSDVPNELWNLARLSKSELGDCLASTAMFTYCGVDEYCEKRANESARFVEILRQSIADASNSGWLNN